MWHMTHNTRHIWYRMHDRWQVHETHDAGHMIFCLFKICDYFILLSAHVKIFNVSHVQDLKFFVGFLIFFLLKNNLGVIICMRREWYAWYFFYFFIGILLLLSRMKTLLCVIKMNIKKIFFNMLYLVNILHSLRYQSQRKIYIL